MGNSNRIVLWIIGALLLGGVLWYGYWFATNFEKQTKEVRTDISPEARKNRYLAAELFLQKNGLKVESQSGRDLFSHNPSANDTIFIGSHSRLFLERNGEKLIDWIRAGGNLILVPDTSPFDDEEPQPLLQELGVELRFAEEDRVAEECGGKTEDCEKKTTDESVTEIEETDEEKENKRFHTVTFRSDHPGEFKARFLRDRYLIDGKGNADVVVGDDGEPNLLMYPLDSGTVTVLSDAQLFRNKSLGKLDHAYLLSLLADRPGTVWIYYSADMPSLLVLVWRHAPYLLLTVIALLLMAGWSMLFKSGPRLKPRYDTRRNLLEHLNATAEFSWRIDKARQLVDDNRHALEQAWRRRHPQLNSLDKEQRCEWIGEKTGLAARAVERTLYGDITSEQDFIRATSVLQKLATQISTHALRSTTDSLE